MCEIVEINTRRKKSVSIAAELPGSVATTHVLVPSERLQQLREFWIQLKADIQAEAGSPVQQLIRR